MMRDGVRIEGMQEAQAAIRRLRDAAPGLAKSAVYAGAFHVRDNIRERAPELSDDYEGSVARSTVVKDGGRTTAIITTLHGLGKTLEDGGEITPRRAGLLAFESGGEIVRPARVTMPARPFFRPGVDESRRSAGQIVRRVATRQFQREAERARRR